MHSIAFLALTLVSTPPCDAGMSILNTTLWTQSSAEYRASALQTYTFARRALDEALASPSTLPPAIILDLDETALDNSAYAAQSVLEQKMFEFDDDWSEWVAQSRAKAVPGATEFLLYAQSRSVTPFYITNRGTDLQAATLVNLQTLGFPLSASEDTLLVRGERPEWNTYDKTPRRDFVASRYRVILLLGDDLNDFVAASGKSQAERKAIVDSTSAEWGTRWFVIPNSMYGSWAVDCRD